MAMFRCDGCGHSQSVKDKLAGREAKCPKCGQIGLVRKSDPALPDAPSSPVSGGVKFHCSSCQKVVFARECFAGKRFRCPECGVIVPVPTADFGALPHVEEPNMQLDVLGAIEESAPSLARRVVSPAAEYGIAPALANVKECPFCGEQILMSAKKCKHCGEWMDGRSSSRPVVSQNTQINVQPTYSNDNGTVVAGYLLAFLLPIGGVIAAIVLLAKGRVGHFFMVLLLSLLMGWFYFVNFLAKGF